MIIAVALMLALGAPQNAPRSEVGIDQRVGETVSLGLTLRDERGAEMTLREAIGGKPTVLALVYYRCPMLCTLILNGLLQSMLEIDFTAGEKFNIVTVSFDPAEGPELARAKKSHYLKAYGRPAAEEGWHFLTGAKEPLDRLCRETGYRISADPSTGQFAHGSAVVLLTPEGRISRYLFGVSYPARELRLSLVEASAGKIGTATDQFLLLCMRYDAATGRYGLAITRILRIAAAATVVGLAGLLVALSRRAKKPQPDPAVATPAPGA